MCIYVLYIMHIKRVFCHQGTSVTPWLRVAMEYVSAVTMLRAFPEDQAQVQGYPLIRNYAPLGPYRKTMPRPL